MSKIRITTAITSAVLLFFTYSCSQGQQSGDSGSGEAPSPEATAAVDAAATVNGQAIPMSELRTAVQNVVMQNGMNAGHLDAFMDQFGPRILDQLIDGELLYQASKKEGKTASQEDIDTAFADLAGRYGSPEEFETEMQNRGFTESTLKESIRKQMSIQKFIQETIVPQADVPEQAVREAYDQNPQNFTSQEEIRASHILINSAEADPQEKKDEALKKATEIAALAKSEGADFAALAREHSQGPSGPSGGDLGFFARGRMVKPFEEAAFSMKVGDISDPVLTKFGYHVIKVTDRKEGSTVSFDEVKEQLEQDLTNRMINELVGQKLSQLREGAAIEIHFTPQPREAPGGTPHGMPMK